MHNAAMETRLPRASDYTPAQRAANFVAPFLRQGFWLYLDESGAVKMAAPEGGELAPEWEKGIKRHGAHLRRMVDRQRAAHGPQHVAQEG